MDEDLMLDNIFVISPCSVEELYNVIKDLSEEKLTEERQIKLLVIDSLSYLTQCLTNPSTRTHLYFQMMNHIQEIQLKNNLIVLIVNELTTQMNAKGEINFESAGGNLLAHRMNRKLRFSRLSDDTFAACIVKSPLFPQHTALFKITQEGVQNRPKI